MKQISEWVSLGHPDKTADYISEYILDRYLERDPLTRFALEVQIKGNIVSLAGEITSRQGFIANELAAFVAQALDQIGYNDEYHRIWGDDAIWSKGLRVITNISVQSPDIKQGVDTDGWGDQGIFFGYAVNDPEDSDRLPKDHALARYIGGKLYQKAKAHPELGWGIDIKTQVVLDEAYHIDKIIVAIPLITPLSIDGIKDYLLGLGVTEDTEIIINGTGSYKQHSAMADAGTTGRKLAVDFYGGNCRIGGGSPWTKDGTKADLTLNLYARELAVQASRKYGKTVTVSLGCCIGRDDVDYCIYDEHNNTIEEGTKRIGPAELTKRYGLREPIFADLCARGLFGSGFAWDSDQTQKQ